MNNPILIEMPMPILTPRLLIRHTMLGDGPKINRAIKDSFEELTNWMPWAKTMPSVDDSEIYVRQSYAKWLLREEATLLILDLSGTTILGATGFHNIKWSVPCFEIGYWVCSSESGKGYISEATNALTRFAFQELKAKRVEICCDADNLRSAKIPTRLGYQLEGRLRSNEVKCHQEGVRDTLVFSRIDTIGLPELDVSWGQSTAPMMIQRESYR